MHKQPHVQRGIACSSLFVTQIALTPIVCVARLRAPVLTSGL